MRHLKIGISARGLNSYASGPAEYIDGLIGEIVRQTTGRHDFFIYYNNRQFLGRFPSAIERVLPATNPFLWDHIFLPIALLGDQLDIVIYPKGTIPFWSPAKKGTIMLDLGYFYPELNAYKAYNTFYMRHAMEYAARNSLLLYAISEFTRQDIIRLLKIESSRVYNIYGAASNLYQRITDNSQLEEVRKKYHLSAPFIFYPTNLSPRKNFRRLLDAFEKIYNDIPHHLYFTGENHWGSRQLTSQLDRLSARVHRLNHVLIEDMPSIYSLAHFVVYPSLFEGLGLPILEAFQCRTPIMVSNQSSIPEVAGNAALIVDAYDVDSIAQGLLKMAFDEELRQKLVRDGIERVKAFTWEKSVKVLLASIENALANRS